VAEAWQALPPGPGLAPCFSWSGIYIRDTTGLFPFASDGQVGINRIMNRVAMKCRHVNRLRLTARRGRLCVSRFVAAAARKYLDLKKEPPGPRSPARTAILEKQDRAQHNTVGLGQEVRPPRSRVLSSITGRSRHSVLSGETACSSSSVLSRAAARSGLAVLSTGTARSGKAMLATAGQVAEGGRPAGSSNRAARPRSQESADRQHSKGPGTSLCSAATAWGGGHFSGSRRSAPAGRFFLSVPSRDRRGGRL
jgi:hypothetical protein